MIIRRCRLLRALLIAMVAVAFVLLGTGRAEAAGPPRYGDSGAPVRSIQNKLIAAGYLRAEHNGGTFGPLTRDALRRVQLTTASPRPAGTGHAQSWC